MKVCTTWVVFGEPTLSVPDSSSPSKIICLALLVAVVFAFPDTCAIPKMFHRRITEMNSLPIDHYHKLLAGTGTTLVIVATNSDH